MTLIHGVMRSGIPTAVVAPRLYLENLLLPVIIGPAREEGVLRYPLPASSSQEPVILWPMWLTSCLP